MQEFASGEVRLYQRNYRNTEPQRTQRPLKNSLLRTLRSLRSEIVPLHAPEIVFLLRLLRSGRRRKTGSAEIIRRAGEPATLITHCSGRSALHFHPSRRNAVVFSV